MTKITNNKSNSAFEEFLKERVPVNIYFSIHKQLGISRKMFTCLMRNPSKIGIQQFDKLSKATNISRDEFFKVLEIQ